MLHFSPNLDVVLGGLIFLWKIKKTTKSGNSPILSLCAKDNEDLQLWFSETYQLTNGTRVASIWNEDNDGIPEASVLVQVRQQYVRERSRYGEWTLISVRWVQPLVCNERDTKEKLHFSYFSKLVAVECDLGL